LSAFWLFVKKELKSIARDPKMLIAMLIVPLIMMGILYGVVIYGVRQQVEQAVRESGSVSVIDMDGDVYSRDFIDYLRSIGVYVVNVDPSYINNISRVFELTNTKILYVIPKGFSSNISRNIQTKIVTYISFSALTIGESGLIESASRLVEGYSKKILQSIATERNLSYNFISRPIDIESYGFIGSQRVSNPSMFMGVITISTIFIPLIVLMLVLMASQIVVTSMAIEKEERMFETLLTLPISRMSIVWAKIFVSLVIGLIYMLLYGILLFSYIFGVINIGLEQQQQIPTPTLPPTLYPSIALNISGAAILILAIAILLGSLAQDVRTAQALLGNVIGPLVILIYIPMFIDIASSPTSRLVVSLIPIANTVFLPKLVLLGDNTSLIAASISNIFYGLAVFLVIRRIVNSETIFTLKIGRLRMRR